MKRHAIRGPNHLRFAVWLVALWVALVALWIMPLRYPRGPYVGGRYSLADLLLGVPVCAAALGMALVAITPRRLHRTIGVRYTACVLGVFAAVALVDTAQVAWRAAAWNYWYDCVGVSRTGNRPDSDRGWARLPRLQWRGRARRETRFVTYRTDESGFRNPPGMSRADLVFIGDSFTEADEVPETQAYARLVGSATGLSTANLGCGGYGPPQELAVLRTRGLALHPRAAIWQIFEGNDLQDAEHFTAWARDPAHAADSCRPHGLVDWYARYSLIGRVLRQSSTEGQISVRLRGADGQYRRIRTYPADAYDPDVGRTHPDGLRTVCDNVRRGARLCRDHHAELLVLLMPSRLRVLAPDLRFRNPRERDRFLPGGAIASPHDLGAALRDSCLAAGCGLLDLYPVLASARARGAHDLFFPSDPHLDLPGHRVVAAAVCGWLRSHRIGQVAIVNPVAAGRN